MGLFDSFRKKKRTEKEDSNQNNKNERLDDFTRDMIKSADMFVERSTERYVGLDFSVESLKVIDNILEDASDFYDEMNDDQRKNIINSAGSYVFEVARKTYGGKYFWYDKLNQPILVTGQPEFEVSILAFDKVKMRIENGEEDNIPFYFKGYVERVKNKQSGMIV